MCTTVLWWGHEQRIVYKRDNYIMHIGDRLPPNKRKTEAGGLGLCVDGTTCLHTYTVYICIMIPFYIWHWKTNCRVSHTLPHFLEEWPLIQTSLCKGFFFLSGGKRMPNVWKVLETQWYMLSREVDGLDCFTRRIEGLLQMPWNHLWDN